VRLCRGHALLNKGIGATNSGLFSVCFDKLVPQVRQLFGARAVVLLNRTVAV
jgi:hypothetical protein